MIIQCENCGTKYRVPDSEIQDNGRFVRCSHCDHEWVAYPTAENECIIESDVRTNTNPFSLNIKAEAQRKAEREARISHVTKASISSVVTLLCVFMIGLGLWIMSLVLLDKEGAKLFSSTPAYSFLSSYFNHDLKITDIEFDLSPTKPHTYSMNVNVSLYNSGNKKQKLSLARVIIFDKDKNEIKKIKIEHNKIINPGQYYVINELINDVPSQAKYFSVDFGEPLELLLRSSLFLINENNHE